MPHIEEGNYPPWLAEEILEDVVKDVTEPALSTEVESLRTLWPTGMAERIVSTPFFLVADDLVGFVQLFKLFFRGFLLFGGRVEIGVVLPGELSECFLDFVVGRGPFDTEGFVIIALSHGG